MVDTQIAEVKLQVLSTANWIIIINWKIHMTLHSMQRWYRGITRILWQSKTIEGLSTKEIFFCDVWLFKKLDKWKWPKLLLSEASKTEAFFMNSWNGRKNKGEAYMNKNEAYTSNSLQYQLRTRGYCATERKSPIWDPLYHIVTLHTVVKHRGIMINNTCKYFSLVIPHINTTSELLNVF